MLENWQTSEREEEEENRIIREAGRSYLLRPLLDTERAKQEINQEEQERFLALTIAGLLPCSVRYRDGTAYFYYDITGRQALCGLYRETEMTYDECCGLLLSLERTLQNIREYLLNENCLRLTADMIFMNINQNEAVFVYDPAQETCFQEEARTLAEFILNHIKQQDDRAVVLSCQFYKYTLAENFSMEEFLLENKHNILMGNGKEEIKSDNRMDAENVGGERADAEEEEEYYELCLPAEESDLCGWNQRKNDLI